MLPAVLISIDGAGIFKTLIIENRVANTLFLVLSLVKSTSNER